MKRRQALKIYATQVRQSRERLARAGRVLKRFYSYDAHKCHLVGYVPPRPEIKLVPENGFEFQAFVWCRCGFVIWIHPEWIGSNHVTHRRSREIARAVVNHWVLPREDRQLFDHNMNGVRGRIVPCHPGF